MVQLFDVDFDGFFVNVLLRWPKWTTVYLYMINCHFVRVGIMFLERWFLVRLFGSSGGFKLPTAKEEGRSTGRMSICICKFFWEQTHFRTGIKKHCAQFGNLHSVLPSRVLLQESLCTCVVAAGGPQTLKGTQDFQSPMCFSLRQQLEDSVKSGTNGGEHHVVLCYHTAWRCCDIQ